MELSDLQKMVDKDWAHGQDTRDKAADDLIFYYITQWDDETLANSPLQYRGQFDIIRKAGRQVLSQLEANPIQIDFEPKDDNRQDAAELADGLYRNDDRSNLSIEAYGMGKQEAVVCGFGAWMLYTEYKTNLLGERDQVIKRKPIYEAVNRVLWDANAKAQDKSDADHVCIIHSYTEDAYRELAGDLLDVDPEDVEVVSAQSPNQLDNFPWFSSGNELIYVIEMFCKKDVKDKVVFMTSPIGQPLALLESQIEEVMDELIDGGYKIDDDKEIERSQITRYLLSGNEILSEDVIAGSYLPVVPMYGERGYVQDEEYYEGIVRLGKDPQRLRNFQMSYLADIVSRSPRRKPIFYPEQIKGFEHMYEDSGAENNYPYLLQHPASVNGQPLPLGPIAEMPEQPMPQALIASIQLSREAVEDVANPALPQNIADPDLSGKAVIALQNRIDMQTSVYQTNYKHAKRRDAMIWAAMASQVYDAPRSATIMLPDGRRQQVDVMNVVLDEQTGDSVVLNDLTNAEFDVYADIGVAYSSQKEQTRAEIQQLMGQAQPGSPEYNLLLLTYFNLVDGIDVKPLRDYANKQLVLQGFKEPETDEEKQLLAQAQQQNQGPTPEQQAMLLQGQGQLLEGQAAMADKENDRIKLSIEQQKVDNDKAKVQIDAAEAGVKMRNVRADTYNKSVEAANKMMLRYQNLS